MDRNQRMRDRAMRRDMRRDGRNPYGSRGGYVRDFNYEMDYNRSSYGSTRDNGRMRDYGRNRDYRGRDYGEYDMRNDYASRNDYGYERDYHSPERVTEYHGSYGNVPFYLKSGENYPDYNMDYVRDYGEDKLEKKDIEEWVEKLMRELEPDEKETFKMDKIIKKATELGEKFEHYNEEELYVATLMIYTDYKKRIGKNNVDLSIRMAKDFLCDPDASVKYGAKLATYYDEIVCGD